jgi:hypothetical protein
MCELHESLREAHSLLFHDTTLIDLDHETDRSIVVIQDIDDP